MTDLDSDIMLDASTAKDRSDWLRLMEQIGRDSGYFQTIGPAHHALFLDNSPSLLVSFDSYDAARTRRKQLPVGVELADECDWSQLCIVSGAGPWYRDPAVYAFFDRMVDDGFFEGFDRVLFYGAGPSGYAAAAFSVTAPGSRLLLLNPIATLTPSLAGWDTRYRGARRLDFTSRYGFAPDMVEGADSATVIHDPASGFDAMHAALFHAPHVQSYRARLAGTEIEATFSRIGILNHLISAAMDGKLTAQRFGALWRSRREDLTYLRQLQVATAPNPAREIMLCRNVATRLRQNRFKKRLADLLGKT
ncbi:MAG: phosphoadenosine phosphosulfate reductase [Cypionkella sp.]